MRKTPEAPRQVANSTNLAFVKVAPHWLTDSHARFSRLNISKPGSLSVVRESEKRFEAEFRLEAIFLGLARDFQIPSPRLTIRAHRCTCRASVSIQDPHFRTCDVREPLSFSHKSKPQQQTKQASMKSKS